MFRLPDIAIDRLGRLMSSSTAMLALSMTAGVVADRLWAIPVSFALALAASCLLARLILSNERSQPRLLFLAAAAIGAAYHHARQDFPAASILAQIATPDGTPIHLHGRLAAPAQRVPGSDDPLVSMARPESSKLLIDVESIDGSAGPEAIAGRILAYVPFPITDIFVGDRIAVRGRLVQPRGPGNPGEADQAQARRDQGIEATLSTPLAEDAVQLVRRGWPATVFGWLGRLHAAARETLRTHLKTESGLATALLLGDGSAMDRPQWDRFLRSGVVHAIAISGQHLVVLAWVSEVLRRLTRIPFKPGVVGIGVILMGYSLLTGGRPPAMRAAWMIAAVGLAYVLGRRPSAIDVFFLSWLFVLLGNPADIFQSGCHLSFLAVGTLLFVTPWVRIETMFDPFVAIKREEASNVERRLSRTGRSLGRIYLVTLVVWLVVTPLVADRFHVVAPIAIVIGPPVVALASVALLSGFTLLAAAPLGDVFSFLPAWITDASLSGVDWLIDVGLAIPGASFYVCDLPRFWVVGWYLGLLAFLLRPRWTTRWWWLAAAVWLALGLAYGRGMFRPNEVRVAFLSVGHGGCTVIEPGDGRVLVYDAGAMSGPDVGRRVIVPYLWSRGFCRVDDLFVSHGDLDHFNGLPELAERLDIVRVTTTPSFNQRGTPGIARVLETLAERRIATRVVHAGHAERIGGLAIDVLHPPADGPPGKENARSLVLWVRRPGMSILLTGDLEDAGRDQVLRLRSPNVDVMLAPHHGGRLANPPALVEWARPRVVVSSQGRRPSAVATMYEAAGVRFLSTHRDGAVIVHPGPRIEPFRNP